MRRNFISLPINNDRYTYNRWHAARDNSFTYTELRYIFICLVTGQRVQITWMHLSYVNGHARGYALQCACLIRCPLWKSNQTNTNFTAANWRVRWNTGSTFQRMKRLIKRDVSWWLFLRYRWIFHKRRTLSLCGFINPAIRTRQKHDGASRDLGNRAQLNLVG